MQHHQRSSMTTTTHEQPLSKSNEEFNNNNNNNYFPEALRPDGEITMLAYGALLSEASSRLTFPDLTHFRHVRVRGLRRVFGHPHLFLIQQGLVGKKQENTNHHDDDADDDADDTDTLPLPLTMASLSAEPTDDPESSFVVAAFQVTLNDEQRKAFIEREASYDIISVPFYELEESNNNNNNNNKEQEQQQQPTSIGHGVICVKSTDEKNTDILSKLPSWLPYSSIWSWPDTSGLLPADIYLRHGLLAVEKGASSSSSSSPGGRAAKESFWKDTYLADRKTTLAEYLSDPAVYKRVMDSRPPAALATRFGG